MTKKVAREDFFMFSLIDEGLFNGTKCEFIGVATLFPPFSKRLFIPSPGLTGMTFPFSAESLFAVGFALQQFPNKINAASAKLRAMCEQGFIDQLRSVKDAPSVCNRSDKWKMLWISEESSPYSGLKVVRQSRREEKAGYIYVSYNFKNLFQVT